MSTQTWSEGDLRSTTLGTNGFPDGLEAAIPDELFLETPVGEVEIIRQTRVFDDDYWRVNGPRENDFKMLFEDFQAAFERALLAVRKEVE